MARTYTTTQVAQLLGFDRKTIVRRCIDGTIPAVRLGLDDKSGQYRIDGAWVERALARLRRPLPPAGRAPGR